MFSVAIFLLIYSGITREMTKILPLLYPLKIQVFFNRILTQYFVGFYFLVCSQQTDSVPELHRRWEPLFGAVLIKPRDVKQRRHLQVFFCNKKRQVGFFIRRFLVHSDTEYRPIEFPISHLYRI